MHIHTHTQTYMHLLFVRNSQSPKDYCRYNSIYRYRNYGPHAGVEPAPPAFDNGALVTQTTLKTIYIPREFILFSYGNNDKTIPLTSWRIFTVSSFLI